MLIVVIVLMAHLSEHWVIVLIMLIVLICLRLTTYQDAYTMLDDCKNQAFRLRVPSVWLDRRANHSIWCQCHIEWAVGILFFDYRQ